MIGLAYGGTPPPPGIDLARYDVDHVEFQSSWGTVPGNEWLVIDGVRYGKYPDTVTGDWIRRQFHLPVRGARTLVWDIEGPRIAGLQTSGSAYCDDLAYLDRLMLETREAVPRHDIWLYNPIHIDHDGNPHTLKEIAQAAGMHTVNMRIEASGMSAYSLYGGMAQHGQREQFWATQGNAILNRVKEGAATYKLAHSLCEPEPETVLYICGIDVYSRDKEIVPDDELIAIIRAGIQGGANRVCYWAGTASLWGKRDDDPAVIAEHLRVIRCMREAAGMPQVGGADSTTRPPTGERPQRPRGRRA